MRPYISHSYTTVKAQLERIKRSEWTTLNDGDSGSEEVQETVDMCPNADLGRANIGAEARFEAIREAQQRVETRIAVTDQGCTCTVTGSSAEVAAAVKVLKRAITA